MGKECYGEMVPASQQRDLARVRLDCSELSPLPLATDVKRRAALDGVVAAARALGFEVVGEAESPIEGRRGTASGCSDCGAARARSRLHRVLLTHGEA